MKNEIKSESAPAHPLISLGLMSPLKNGGETTPIKRGPGFKAPDFPEAAPAKAGSTPESRAYLLVITQRDILLERNSALLTALKMFAFDYSPSPRNLAQYRDAARAAIALAEGAPA